MEVAYPGGCEIGLRPIDLHLKGLRKLGGVDISEKKRLAGRQGKGAGGL